MIDGKQCLQYESWLANPLIKSFVCKKVTKLVKDGKESFVSSTDKKNVLKTTLQFLIYIAQCSEKGF